MGAEEECFMPDNGEETVEEGEGEDDRLGREGRWVRLVSVGDKA